MTEIKQISVKTTSCEVDFNGEKLTIHKLKAGKYYEAQKIYIGMIDTIRKQSKYELKPQDKEKGKKSENLSSEDLEAVSSLDITGLYSVFPQEIAKLVAFCVGIKVEKLLEDAYPEEISNMAEKVITLNNFNENLKNSVAPLESLGAAK